ncbi:A24 family peptidase [Cupriavidus basilensis]|uniref:A24 family peptidase n=1 Tax=Cupriavidus basilensis TaxID=68895 RepID=UPI0005BB00BF|nr:prepilin peptidase [Cupriavidus basilensis]
MLAQSALPQYVGPLVIVLVLTAAAIDAQQRRIPNWLTFGAWLLALPVQIILHGWGAGALAWASGWLTGFALFLPLYLLRGMAAGDVKLMAAVGAWLGAPMAFEIALATFVAGGVWALALTLWRGRLGQLRRNLAWMLTSFGQVRPTLTQDSGARNASSWSVGSLPYGVAIAAGTIGVLFASA